MTDYTDYEQFLEDALFDALIILRKTEDLYDPEPRQKLYAALDRIRRDEDAYRAYWEEPRVTGSQLPAD